MTADGRGKITTGKKGKSSTGKDIPKSVDHFNIEKFPELVHIYGEKPDKLFILFPSDNVDDFFQTEYNRWATSDSGNPWKKRSCDGETCYHNSLETLRVDGKDQDFKPGEEHECFKCHSPDDCSLDSDDRCSTYTAFSAFILDPRSKHGTIVLPRPYRFQTNSVNSSDNLLSELFNIFDNFGGLSGIPFVLSVKMTESQVIEKGKTQMRKFPLWNLEAYGSVAMINMFRDRKQLPTRQENAIIIDESKMIESPEGDLPWEKDTSLKTPPQEPQEEVGTSEPSPIPESDESESASDTVEEEKTQKDEFQPTKSADPLDTDFSVLAKMPEIDKDDAMMIVGGISAMILDMVNQDKPKAREILKEVSLNPNTSEKFDKTEQLKGLPILRLRGIFNNTKSKYRAYLTKIISAKQQEKLF
jgi:hypothetical protein